MQILYSYPPEKEINSDVASFCFPHGVNPVLLERTPSMSSLNEIVYSQKFLHSDSNSFVFLMKVPASLSHSLSLKYRCVLVAWTLHFSVLVMSYQMNLAYNHLSWRQVHLSWLSYSHSIWSPFCLGSFICFGLCSSKAKFAWKYVPGHITMSCQIKTVLEKRVCQD